VPPAIEKGRAITLAELGALVHADVDGDPEFEVKGPASLTRASASDISFFSDPRRSEDLRGTLAGAVVLARSDRRLFAGPCLISDDPYRTFVQLCAMFQAESGEYVPGVSETAVVDASAILGGGVCVGPGSVIASDAVLGKSVRVGPNVYIGSGVSIGDDTRIASGVNIYPGCTIGRRCRVESGVVIGSPGFGYLESRGGWEPVPQIGSVRIGDDVDIGANTTIDRGTLDDTVIEDGVKLDNQIQVAHNVVIGAHTAIAGCTGIAGSARIGKRCKIGGRASILGHLSIADDVTILATSVVTRSIVEKGEYSSYLTVMPAQSWRRVVARLAKLDDLFRRIRSLERRVRGERDREVD
jgi:UDP-3-O-[3-hydroxymyristoyl] glucosamine N-acyltransferase